MHPASLPFLYKLRRSQWWSAAELEELQWRRLSKLLRHAYAHTSYYRRLFESVGLLPDDVRSIDDLKRLPVTTKDDLQRESVENLIATSHERQVSIERRTSGTTGQPLQFLLTRRQKEAQDMVQARALIENGMLLMDRRAVFVAPWQIPERPLWFQRFGFWRKTNLSVFADIGEIYSMLVRENPQSIAGTPAILNLIAIENDRIGQTTLSPRTIFSSGDLLDGGTRARIQAGLGAPVTDLFGSLELGFIAWECSEHSGYHINAESVVIEIDSDSDSGEIICTNLLAYGMPLIRYRLGDRCQLEKRLCPCGRGLPLIKLIEGRTNDIIHLPDGRAVTPQAVADTMVESADAIQQFKIVQQRLDLIEILLVSAGKENSDLFDRIAQALRSVLGDQVELSFRRVDAIPPDPSGKRRAIVSNLSLGNGE